jgi:hypothetical protein
MDGVKLVIGVVGPSSTTIDNTCALLVNGNEIAAVQGFTGLENGTVYLITNVGQAEAMGITKAYDSINKIRVHRHISEFFRMAGDGTKLYLVVGEPGYTMVELIEHYGQKIIIESKGEVSYMGVAFNPPEHYATTYVNGLEETIHSSIQKAQELFEWSWETNRPVSIVLEGRGMNNGAATMLNLRNITIGAASLNATHVLLCVGQDWDYAETQDTRGKLFADVGTLLGTKAFIGVNRDIGEVEALNLSNAVKGIWLTAGLSNHQTTAQMDADLSVLDGKGYVFGVSYTGISGYRWNGDHVCAPIVVDDDGNISISTLGHAATINKASREIRKMLLLKLKSTVPVDSKTGFLPAGVRKWLENIADAAFTKMGKAGEISDGKTAVDPTSQLLTGAKELKVSFVIVPTATIGKIKGTINLKTTISNGTDQ